MSKETTDDQDVVKDPELTKEYVAELRKKADSYRLKLKDAEDRLEFERSAHSETKTKLETETASRLAAETSGLEARKSADSRIIAAELKSLAREAGLIDVDDLRLIASDQLKLSDTGEVEGLHEVVESFKTNKPHLFKPREGEAEAAPKTPSQTTSQTQIPPSAKPPGPKSALDMTPEEYTAAKAQIIR
jgi:hypothetical protein